VLGVGTAAVKIYIFTQKSWIPLLSSSTLTTALHRYKECTHTTTTSTFRTSF